MIDIVAIIISFCALGVSIYIGQRQVKISQTQVDMQNKVELYLSHEPITLHKADGSEPDKLVPGLFIRNIGSNVVYLEKYIFNGKEYPLKEEVLPSVSTYSSFHYIFLPTDGTSHISLSIFFTDWQGNKWITKGYADFREGTWDISYSPCVQDKNNI